MGVDNLGSLIKSLNELASKEVLVGIPDSKASRNNEDGEPVNNAQLGYIHEYGSPANHIPARPFLGIGITNAKKAISAQLAKTAKDAIDGKSNRVENGLNRAGIIAQNSVKSVFSSGELQPLANSTLRSRVSRGGTRGKAASKELRMRAEYGISSNEEIKPLVDTGQLRNSITYVVRKK